MNIQPFQSLVKEKCGLCFEAEKAAVLNDSILARMTKRGMTRDTEYLACLRQDDNEFHSLVNLLTVNETYFFREPAHLDLLTEQLLPEMLPCKTPAEPVRILCAGCSTGEEPYSVMMKLFEKFGAGIRGLVSVIGVDIDSAALERAEQGVYSGFSFREFPKALRDKYFEEVGNDCYRVRDFIRERVSFRKLNLLSDLYPDILCGLDAIFYRNVSIYFDAPTQLSIFNRLAGLLKEKGWLFVSSTETLSHNHGILALIELEGVFCFQKSGTPGRGDRKRPAGAGPEAGRIKEVRPGLSAFRPVPPALPKQAANRRQVKPLSFNDALALAGKKQYEESLQCLDLLLEQDQSFMKAYMLKAGVLINMKRLNEAEKVCKQSIERERWNLEGHLLLGLIAKLKSDHETAIKRFKEAVYIQSSCWLGHFYLAEIQVLRNETKQAIREYEIVTKLLSKGDLADHGLTFFPLAFPAEQIKHLCQHNLEKLRRGKR